jgi:hypothetical protein
MMSQRSREPEQQASRFGTGTREPEGLAELRITNVEALLDRVEDRDRAILAMLMERIHPADIAATLGISAAKLRLRHARIVARLRSDEAASFTGSTEARRDKGSCRAGTPVISRPG